MAKKEYDVDWSNVNTFHKLRDIIKAAVKTVKLDEETARDYKHKGIIK